jgi:hypothetical protein
MRTGTQALPTDEETINLKINKESPEEMSQLLEKYKKSKKIIFDT